MKLIYKLEKEDFLQFQLFAAFKSDRIQKNIRRNRVILLFIWLGCSLFFYYKGIVSLTIYFAFVAMMSALFHNRVVKWRYKKHYRGHIEENYSKRFGATVELEFSKTTIKSKDKTGESLINISAIDSISETQNHFFIKISTGITLLIPKKEIEELDKLRTLFSELRIEKVDETNWKW